MRLGLLRCLPIIFMIIAMSVNMVGFAQTTAHHDAPAVVNLNKDMLVGRWTAGNEDVTLSKSGASFITINTKTCPGTWTLKDKALTIIPAKQMWKKNDPCSSTRVWQVRSLTVDNLELIDAAGSPLHLTRQK